MPVYRLHYFDVRNLGEAIRMLFHIKGQKFEDIRVPFDQWPKKKKEVPFGRLPMLEVDGKKLVQSQAILRFLGRRFNMAGRDAWEQARVDEMADLFLDLHAGCRPFVIVAAGLEQGDEAQLKKSALQPAVDRYFPLYSKLLKENGSGFLVGRRLTYCDLQLADLLFTLRMLAPEMFDRHLDLSTYVDRIYAHSSLKKYIAQRPTSQM